MDRMDFEELALKSIDLSRSPSITQFRSSAVSESNKEPSSVRAVPFRIHSNTLTRETKISLVYPPSVLPPSEALSELRAYAEHRIPKHRNGFYLWMLVTPLTAPLKLIRASYSICTVFIHVIGYFSNHTQSSIFLLRLAFMVAL